jgi:hypothetical protein
MWGTTELYERNQELERRYIRDMRSIRVEKGFHQEGMFTKWTRTRREHPARPAAPWSSRSGASAGPATVVHPVSPLLNAGDPPDRIVSVEPGRAEAHELVLNSSRESLVVLSWAGLSALCDPLGSLWRGPCVATVESPREQER